MSKSHNLFEEYTMNTFFPSILLTYLEMFRQHFTSPSYAYFKSYVWAMMILETRKTVTNIAHACFFLEKHIASFERFLSENKWDMNQVAKTLVHLLLKALNERLLIHGALLMCVDTTFSAKASRKMMGVQKWSKRSGNSDRGEHIIGHQWAIAALVSSFAKRFLSWPVLTRMVSGNKNPSHYVSTPQGIRRENFWDAVIAVALHTKSLVGDMAVRLVADAQFASAVFINPMIAASIHVITRWRNDGVGWDDPPAYSGRGRPRKRGKQWKLAELLTSFTPQMTEVNIYGKRSLVAAVTRDLWLRDIPQKVRVVVTEGIRKPIIFISTDMSLTGAQIIQIYSARFSIEIAIRDLKQHFGFCDYQATTTTSIFRFVQLSCISSCLWRLMLLPENASTWLSDMKSEIINESEFSFARARRGLKQFVIKEILFRNSASTAELEKVDDVYEHISRIAA